MALVAQNPHDSTPRHILELSNDALGHVLQQLPDAEAIARVALTCRAFKLASQHAAITRAAASYVPLPPLKEGESKLHALRWAELAGTHAPGTVAAGRCLTACIAPCGSLLCWGLPNFGTNVPLSGTEKAPVCRTYTPPRDAAGFCGVSTKERHALILGADGSVWSIGDGSYGRLGVGNEQDHNSQPMRLTSIAGTRVLQVSAGSMHSLLLTSTGSVLAFGWNRAGQLGLGEHETQDRWLYPVTLDAFAGRRVVEVSAGGMHSAAVDEESELWTWGIDDDGQLGRDPEETHGMAMEWRPGKVALRHVRHVSTGSKSTLAVTRKGELYAFGKNEFGQLGPDDEGLDEGAPVQRQTPWRVRQAAVGYGLSVVLSESGEVSTMGRIRPPNPGVNPGVDWHISETIPFPTTTLRGVVEVAAGFHHCVAKTADGKLYGWGYGGFVGEMNHLTVLVPTEIVLPDP